MFFGADGVAATGESASAQEKIEERKRNDHATEARILQLYNAWSSMLNTTSDEVLKSPDVPWPPHLDDCKLNVERNKRFDSYGDNSTFPHWTLWKGSLGLELWTKSTQKMQISIDSILLGYANLPQHVTILLILHSQTLTYTHKLTK